MDEDDGALIGVADGFVGAIGAFVSDPIGSIVGGIGATVDAGKSVIDCLDVWVGTCEAGDRLRLAAWYLTEVAGEEEKGEFAGGIVASLLLAKGGSKITGPAASAVRSRISQLGLSPAEALEILRGTPVVARGATLTADTLASVRAHLNRPEFLVDGKVVPENVAMLARLQGVLDDGRQPTGVDAAFFRHELAELRLMKGGMDYETAHPKALEMYGLTEPALYAPEVVRAYPGQFSDLFRTYWGIDE